MIVNGSNLRTLGITFNAAFMKGLGQAVPQWTKVATHVPSSTLSQEYGWMREIPEIREWVGERTLNNLATYDYSIKNKDWEDTISVPRNNIEDDNLGLFGARFEMLGKRVTMFPDRQVFGLLALAFTSKCYDGQNFCDTAHPVLDVNGASQSVSNITASGTTSQPAWFLMAADQPLKPLIYQERKPFEFVAMTRLDDERVFTGKEFRYGVDGRNNVGFGFWQTVQGCRDVLSAANFQAAYQALETRTGDFDVKLNLAPSTLVCGPSNRAAAFALLKAETYIPAGGTYPVPNPWFGTAEPVITPLLP